MGIVHELLISFFIAGFLILAVLAVNQSLTTQVTRSQLMVSTQQSAALLYEMIQRDFRKIGIGFDPPRSSIQSMSESQIIFLADIDGDGDLEEVRYQLSDTAAAAGTPNPSDRLLIRTVDDEEARAAALGVTNLELTYFDDGGAVTAETTHVTSIGVHLVVESTFDFDGFFGRAELDTRITPKTLAQNNW